MVCLVVAVVNGCLSEAVVPTHRKVINDSRSRKCGGTPSSSGLGLRNGLCEKGTNPGQLKERPGMVGGTEAKGRWEEEPRISVGSQGGVEEESRLLPCYAHTSRLYLVGCLASRPTPQRPEVHVQSQIMASRSPRDLWKLAVRSDLRPPQTPPSRMGHCGRRDPV